MEEIKVGDYIRTDEGIIAKITSIEYGQIRVDRVLTYLGQWAVPYNVINDNEISKIKKHSLNIIDLIEDEDIVILEYKSPKYKERIIRRFEVSKIDDDIRFENAHCSFHCKVGDTKIVDKICKNIKIKGIVTIESFESIKYEV